MIRYKTNKQAIIIAALIILLCLTTLTGATLALFTNDPKDGTIGIVTTTGNVDVDIVDDTDAHQTLVGSVLQFRSSNDGEIFFEPGATYGTEGFKIANKGDIPIKFRVYISEDEEEDMNEFHKAFEVWIGRSENPDGTTQKITEFEDELPVGAISEDTYYLFVKMKETADNTFQNTSYSGIGITVYAVQGNADISRIKE